MIWQTIGRRCFAHIERVWAKSTGIIWVIFGFHFHNKKVLRGEGQKDVYSAWIFQAIIFIRTLSANAKVMNNYVGRCPTKLIGRKDNIYTRVLCYDNTWPCLEYLYTRYRSIWLSPTSLVRLEKSVSFSLFWPTHLLFYLNLWFSLYPIQYYSGLLLTEVIMLDTHSSKYFELSRLWPWN